MTARPKNAIVIVIDGLQAGMLGCYGNTWIKTPEIDRLAAESFVFDQAIVDTPFPSYSIEAQWSGTHVLSWIPARKRFFFDPSRRPEVDADLFRVLSASGIAGQIVTDNAFANDGAGCFGNVPTIFLPPRNRTVPVHDWEESQMAMLFGAATEWLLGANEPFCLWVHSQGMKGSWDAPYEMRQQYADIEDPAPPKFIEPPKLKLPENFDPDELLGIQQAYAAQGSLLDTCLGVFADALRESPLADDTLLVLLGASGFGLGEHRLVGNDDASFHNIEFYSEIVQVPWFIRLPDGAGNASRTNALVQPPDLYPTLLDYFGIVDQRTIQSGQRLWPLIRGEVERVHDRAGTYFTNDEWSLRTEKWHLRSSSGDETKLEPPKMELYVKPDDRFEVNDVSSRCPEVVAALQEAWRDLVAVAESGRWEELPPLPAAATEGVD